MLPEKRLELILKAIIKKAKNLSFSARKRRLTFVIRKKLVQTKDTPALAIRCKWKTINLVNSEYFRISAWTDSISVDLLQQDIRMVGGHPDQQARAFLRDGVEDRN